MEVCSTNAVGTTVAANVDASYHDKKNYIDKPSCIPMFSRQSRTMLASGAQSTGKSCRNALKHSSRSRSSAGDLFHYAAKPSMVTLVMKRFGVLANACNTCICLIWYKLQLPAALKFSHSKSYTTFAHRPSAAPASHSVCCSYELTCIVHCSQTNACWKLRQPSEHTLVKTPFAFWSPPCAMRVVAVCRQHNSTTAPSSTGSYKPEPLDTS